LNKVEINPDVVWLYTHADLDTATGMIITIQPDVEVNTALTDERNKPLTKSQQQFIEKYKSLFPETPPDTLPPERNVKQWMDMPSGSNNN
jgi:hypothetical protein